MLNSEAVAAPVSAQTARIAPFGKYLLLQRVSVGGMAEVFKAIPEGAQRIDQIVAIKRILPSIAEDSEFIGMFVDEARVAGQLNHPNICRIYELGRVNHDHYIAMQFLWGRDLLKVMNRHKKLGRFVSPSLAAFVGAKALSALSYAHTKCDEHGQPLNIIHRDVSPQNIIVGYSGQVKLIDFGVARAATQRQRTQAGILKGKFGYMSPEMIRGLPVDHRSDVFAMGICLYELLTSSRLFYGETDFATLELVRDAKVTPPSLRAPGVPPELDAIVMKALAREVETRFQSAEEMKFALEEFLANHDRCYGQTDVGAVMREAFQVEVRRERERLETFWAMLDRGELVRGALIPPSTLEHELGERSPTPAPIGALIRGAVAPAAPALFAPTPAQEREEQTHIFFSASELDEIRELESEQPPQTRQRMLSDMVPSPSPAISNAVQAATSSGTFPRVSSFPPPAFGPTYAGPSHAIGERARNAGASPPKRGSGRLLRVAAASLLVCALGAALYALQPLAKPETGALEIAAVGDPGALVRVDGILRGNPPLVVEGLKPGLHQIEIEALGFELARAEVQVAHGQAHPVQLTLQKAPVETKVAGLSAQPLPSPAPQITSLANAPNRPSETRARVRAHTRSAEERDEQEPAATRAGRVSRAARERHQAEGDPAQAAEAETAGDEASAALEGLPGDEAGEQPDEAASAPAEGELLISTEPWSRVFVDDEDTGRETPVRALRVPAGPHRIGLRTPDDVMHHVDVVVAGGQVVRIVRRF